MEEKLNNIIQKKTNTNTNEFPQRRILPSRANRGNRMKALENFDLKKDDEIYNNIFAEGSSEDDDFEVSKSNCLNEDSFDSDFYQEESISEFDEGDEDKGKMNNQKKNNSEKIDQNEKYKKGINKDMRGKGKIKLGKKVNENYNKEKNEEVIPPKLNIDSDITHNISIDKTPIEYNSNLINEKNLEENEITENNTENNINQKEEYIAPPKKGRLGLKISKKSLGKSNLNFLLKEPEPLPNEEAILLGMKRNRRKISYDNVVDLEMLDIDKIDEMENMDEEEIESSESEKKELSENSEEFIPKLSEKKIKEKSLQADNNYNENVENSDIVSEGENKEENIIYEKEESVNEKSEKSDKINKFKFKQKIQEKKIRFTRKFIDYDEDEDFIKKKKKFKESINRGKKLNAKVAKKRINEDDEKINKVNDKVNSSKKENKVYNINENKKDEFYNSQNTTKGVLGSSDRKNTRNRVATRIEQISNVTNFDNIMNKQSNEYVIISDFNIIIKKSILEETKDISFILKYPNPEIIFSDTNTIILPKYILTEASAELNSNQNKKVISKKKSNSTDIIQPIQPIRKVSEKNRKFSDVKNQTESNNEIACLYQDGNIQEKFDDFDVDMNINEDLEDNLNDDNYENEDNNDNSESDLMKYNDKNYRRKQKVFDEDFVVGTQKKLNVPKVQTAQPKLSYHEKLSQKDLLYEAIFTELYNIKSLEDMQRLEELNKRDVNYSNKKQFSEFIKTKRKIIRKDNVENEDIDKDKIEINSHAKSENEKFSDEKDNLVNKVSKEGFKQIDNQKKEDMQNTIIKINEEKKEDFEEEKPEKMDIEELIQRKIKELEQEEKSEDDMETAVTFSNKEFYNRIFNIFNRKPETKKESHLCAITGLPSKYFDPLTKQHYANTDAFKVLREKYFQKEEDALLFRIQTLSDLASQKKEKLKKLVLSNNNTNNRDQIAAKNLISMVNKYGILKNDNNEIEKKVISHRIYNRNRENCLESGMLLSANIRKLVISKRIFRDKHSNKILVHEFDDKNLSTLLKKD